METDRESELRSQVEERESDLEYIKEQIKTLFENVVKDTKTFGDSPFYEGQFTAAARACSICGIGIDEQKAIEKSIKEE